MGQWGEDTGYVFEQNRGAGLADGADHGDEGLAGIPVGAGDDGVLVEHDWLQRQQPRLVDRLDRLVDPLLSPAVTSPGLTVDPAAQRRRTCIAARFSPRHSMRIAVAASGMPRRNVMCSKFSQVRSDLPQTTLSLRRLTRGSCLRCRGYANPRNARLAALTHLRSKSSTASVHFATRRSAVALAASSTDVKTTKALALSLWSGTEW